MSIGSTPATYPSALEDGRVPEYHLLSARVRRGPRGASLERATVKTHPLPEIAVAATLQSVLDRLAVDDSLSEIRKRDLRSAVISFAKLVEQPPAAIPLDVARIRRTLDGMAPGRAKISAKRWANLRSDLTAAIRASGLQPMLNTADLDLDPVWSRGPAPADPGIRHRLSPVGPRASRLR